MNVSHSAVGILLSQTIADKTPLVILDPVTLCDAAVTLGIAGGALFQRKDFDMAKVININGKEIDFSAASILMDEEICEKLASDGKERTEQEFFSAYEKAHAEKYGEEWELSKANPVW